MKRFLPFLVVILVILSPLPAFDDAIEQKCPPLDRIQHFRVEEEAKSPVDVTPIAGLAFDEFKPFCQRVPTAVACSGGRGHLLSRDQVVSIALNVQAHFEYRDDYVAFGRADYWQTNVTCGDCEDYALTVSEVLHRAGQAGPFMKLMLWEPYAGAGHATLIVQTEDDGEWELGVGDPPMQFSAKIGRRFAFIRFDGKRKVQAMPGFTIRGDNVWAPGQ